MPRSATLPAAFVAALAACHASTPASDMADAHAPDLPKTVPIAPPIPPPPSGAPSVDAAGLPCDAMTVSQCLASTDCVLEPRGPDAGWTPRYVCRDATLPCEKGHHQTDKAACEKIPGCTFQPPACFCPGSGDTKVPDKTVQPIECYCGGGSPGTCVKSSAAPR